MPEVRKSYDEALNEIRAEVVKLSVRTCEQIGAATQALLDADLDLVERVYTDHAELQTLNHEVELQVYELMARQQPVASDLRTLLAVLRILHELSLTTGLMRNVARQTRRIYPHELHPRVRGILERMGAQASVQLHLAADAFADLDAATAAALPDMDDVMDDLQKELFRAIFATSTGDDEAGIQRAVQVAFLGRDYERAADHAVTMGYWTRFVITGELPSEAPEESPES